MMKGALAQAACLGMMGCGLVGPQETTTQDIRPAAGEDHRLVGRGRNLITHGVYANSLNICLRGEARRIWPLLEQGLQLWLDAIAETGGRPTAPVRLVCPDRSYHLSVDFPGNHSMVMRSDRGAPVMTIAGQHGQRGDIIFHELGHAFGLSDFYHHDDLCRPGNRNIMCRAPAGKGIQELERRGLAMIIGDLKDRLAITAE